MRLEIAGSVAFREIEKTVANDSRRRNEIVSGQIIERYWVLSQRPLCSPDSASEAPVKSDGFAWRRHGFDRQAGHNVLAT
jgi:hypothetical protein